MKTYQSFSTRKTSQKEPIPGSAQVENNAGGFAWQIDKWERLNRFLVLGSEGGTYYVGEKKLTAQNATAALECIKEDGKRVVDTVVDISTSGRAPKNDPALFVLAMAASDPATSAYALDALPKVARIGTHLFHFCAFVQQFRGWGRGLREGVAKWYTDKDPERLAYQVIKYQGRDGWTHRDVLRKSHPVSEAHNSIFGWVTQNKECDNRLIQAHEAAKKANTPGEIAKLILYHGLPRESVPTHFLNDLPVWEALVEKMPMTAMIRNLGKMTNIGLVTPMGEHARHIVGVVTSKDALKKARIHPLSVLVALKTYESGRGVRGKLNWDPVREIVDALDDAFYLAFDSVEPTNKRTMLALDVSSSMTWNGMAGMPGITPRIGSAAMALVTANVEPQYMFFGFSREFIPLSISPRQRLDDVVRYISGLGFGGTDCALPMLYALQRKIEVDTFIVYTDSETWAGNIHPSQALNQYRQKMGIPAKLIVVGMEANEFSIADPNDRGMLDVVGFDTATPQIMSNFAR